MTSINARILPRKSSVSGESPTPGDLEVAEIAINTADGKIFTKHTDNTVVQIGGNSASLTEWIITNNGTSAYNFSGPGFEGNEDNPTIYVQRGQKYSFSSQIGAHPFQLQSTQGVGGTLYTDGVVGDQPITDSSFSWTVPMDSPSELYYQCTAHQAMQGLVLVGGGGSGAVDSVNGETGAVSLGIQDMNDFQSDLALVEGDILQWDSTDSKFKPAQISGLGGDSLPYVLESIIDSAATAATTQTLSAPASSEGDLLIACIVSRDSSGTLTPPSGWTLYGEYLSGIAFDGDGQTISVFTKTATASEPADYTWTQATSGRICGFAVSVREADSITSIEENYGSDTQASITTMAGVLNITAATWVYTATAQAEDYSQAGPGVTQITDAPRGQARISGGYTSQGGVVTSTHDSNSQDNNPNHGIIKIVLGSTPRVDSVNGQTGVVSLGIQDMDDFELLVNPEEVPVIDFTCKNGYTEVGSYTIQVADSDCQGRNYFTYLDTAPLDQPVHTLYYKNAEDAEWSSFTQVKVNSNQSIRFNTPEDRTAWLAADPDYFALNTLPSALVNLPLAQGDILEWNDGDQKFKPTQVARRIQDQDDFELNPAEPFKADFRYGVKGGVATGPGEWGTNSVRWGATDSDGKSYTATGMLQFWLSPDEQTWTEVNEAVQQYAVDGGGYAYYIANSGTLSQQLDNEGWTSLYLTFTNPATPLTEAPLEQGDVLAWNAVDEKFKPAQLPTRIQDQDDFELNVSYDTANFVQFSGNQVQEEAIWTGLLGWADGDFYIAQGQAGSPAAFAWNVNDSRNDALQALQVGDVIAFDFDTSQTYTVTEVGGAYEDERFFRFDADIPYSFGNPAQDQAGSLSNIKVESLRFPPVVVGSIPLEQGDILQWDSVDQKFKPAQLPSTVVPPVVSVNGETGVVSLGIQDLNDVHEIEDNVFDGLTSRVDGTPDASGEWRVGSDGEYLEYSNDQQSSMDLMNVGDAVTFEVGSYSFTSTISVTNRYNTTTSYYLRTTDDFPVEWRDGNASLSIPAGAALKVFSANFPLTATTPKNDQLLSYDSYLGKWTAVDREDHTTVNGMEGSVILGVDDLDNFKAYQERAEYGLTSKEASPSEGPSSWYYSNSGDGYFDYGENGNDSLDNLRTGDEVTFEAGGFTHTTTLTTDPSRNGDFSRFFRVADHLPSDILNLPTGTPLVIRSSSIPLTDAPTVDGQVLTWSEVDSSWTPVTGGAVDSVNGETGNVVLDLEDLDNVTAPASVYGGQTLSWNASTSQWEPAGKSIRQMDDYGSEDSASWSARTSDEYPSSNSGWNYYSNQLRVNGNSNADAPTSTSWLGDMVGTSQHLRASINGGSKFKITGSVSLATSGAFGYWISLTAGGENFSEIQDGDSLDLCSSSIEQGSFLKWSQADQEFRPVPLSAAAESGDYNDLINTPSVLEQDLDSVLGLGNVTSKGFGVGIVSTGSPDYYSGDTVIQIGTTASSPNSYKIGLGSDGAIGWVQTVGNAGDVTVANNQVGSDVNLSSQGAINLSLSTGAALTANSARTVLYSGGAVRFETTSTGALVTGRLASTTSTTASDPGLTLATKDYVDAQSGGGSGGGGGAYTAKVSQTVLATSGTIQYDQIGRSGILVSVSSDVSAWVTFYTTAANMAADASRLFDQDPSPGSGVLAEVYVQAGQTVNATPGTTYYNNEEDEAFQGFIFAAVRDQSGNAAAATVTTTAYAAVDSTGGASSLGDLDDVEVSNPVPGAPVVWAPHEGQWVQGAPTTNWVGDTPEQYASETSCLMNFNGDLDEEVGLTVLDLSYPWTYGEGRNGTPSLEFDGNRRFEVNSDTSLDLDGDFTIEFWWRPNYVTGAFYGLLNRRPASGSNPPGGWQIYQDATGRIVFVDLQAGNFMSAPTSLLANEWAHIAVTRVNSNVRIFVDGAGQGTWTCSTDFTSSYQLNVGQLSGGGVVQAADGRIDDLRITKGVDRYGVGPFTPPESELSLSSGLYVAQSTSISTADLKTLVAASVDFADFQSRIAAL